LSWICSTGTRGVTYNLRELLSNVRSEFKGVLPLIDFKSEPPLFCKFACKVTWREVFVSFVSVACTAEDLVLSFSSIVITLRGDFKRDNTPSLFRADSILREFGSMLSFFIPIFGLRKLFAAVEGRPTSLFARWHIFLKSKLQVF